MEIKTKYDLKQMLYIMHDPEQLPRMVTEITIITPRLIRYQLSCGSENSDHYEYELSAEEDKVKALTAKTTGE
ncbi:MAG: hypothetical protein ACT4OJ_04890 [Bacteroidota bacterium]